ncbi:MAG: serine hydrolase [Minisyncoccia bacterium]|jgi:D-alanyl-D-alanine carboxypeptidase (penicillin-binding protein 5/6)
MNNTFAKFAFLAVVIGAVLFSRMMYPAAAPAANLASANNVTRGNASSAVPMFILPSAAVSAGGGSSIGSASEASGVGSDTRTEADVPVANIPVANAPAANTPAASVPAMLSGGSAPPPALQDAAWLVADLTSGTVFASANADARWPTASIAKLMTATVVEDKLSAATAITITEDMFATDVTEQTLVVGGRYTVSDLLRAMLLPSSNVAAEALASFYGRNAFLAEMNARAAAWGMSDTHFDDPSGISAGDESTANDLLKLAQKIYADYPQIFQITRTPQATIAEETSGKKILLTNINEFAGDADFIGGKTGYTDQADGNLLSVFRDGRKPLVVVVLGSGARFDDTKALYDWYKAK